MGQCHVSYKSKWAIGIWNKKCEEFPLHVATTMRVTLSILYILFPFTLTVLVMWYGTPRVTRVLKWRLYFANGKSTEAREKAPLMETNSTVCFRLSGIFPSL